MVSTDSLLTNVHGVVRRFDSAAHHRTDQGRAPPMPPSLMRLRLHSQRNMTDRYKALRPQVPTTAFGCTKEQRKAAHAETVPSRPPLCPSPQHGRPGTHGPRGDATRPKDQPCNILRREAQSAAPKVCPIPSPLRGGTDQTFIQATSVPRTSHTSNRTPVILISLHARTLASKSST